MTSLPDYVAFRQYPKTPLRRLFTAASDDTLDLLGKMLAYDPRQRITAQDALKHQFFLSRPLPTLPSRLPKQVKETKEQGMKRKLMGTFARDLFDTVLVIRINP